ncbi:MAG TPA: phosphatidylglycerol lysyltransferase domain-containing protein [Candidatus Rifleibacterium sp.]|nr:phosphatidylglycerol lysyltransferase domain-containing protein [Candidatus Rifleibacterium sp.]HPT47299.1 phosphatidylglycerol lysyltransferase domain-containing protein [Candidatus Rifleibacterium sp.]
MNNIPEFPQQTEITGDHRQIIKDALTAQEIRSADYSHYYLTGWFYHRPARISRIGERLVLDVEGKQGGHIFLGPFGTGPLKPAVEKLLHHAEKDFSEERVLRYVPGSLADAIIAEMPPQRSEEHRDYFDYLYLREELADLNGSKFAKRRNLLNKFQRENNAEVVLLKETDSEQILLCLDKWYERYGDEDKFLDMERESVRRMLPNLWRLGGIGIRVMIQENMCGISWAVPITDETWLVPVEKAPREVKGMYQYVNWALANNLPAQVKILNREADMGIEGLRIAKERYNPMGFEKKITLWF